MLSTPRTTLIFASSGGGGGSVMALGMIGFIICINESCFRFLGLPTMECQSDGFIPRSMPLFGRKFIDGLYEIRFFSGKRRLPEMKIHIIFSDNAFRLL